MYCHLENRVAARKLWLKIGAALACSLFEAGCGSTTPPSARCASDEERLGIGEILSGANACKEAFPDLESRIDQILQPLERAHAGCFAQYRRPGQDRDLLETAVALSKRHLGRDKTKFCITDLEEAVARARVLLGK